MLKKEPILFHLLVAFAAYIVLSPIVFLITGDFFHAYLIWNMILAIVPVMLAWLLATGKVKKKGIAILVAILWLLFYPNALYVLTDLVYVSERLYFIQANPYAEMIYLDTFVDWLALFHIAAGAFLAAYGGTYSLVLMYREGKKHWPSYVVILLTIGISFLAGVGVYIGRFFRYNSWDFVRIIAIFRDLLDAFSWNMVGFILIMVAVQLGLFVLLYPVFRSRTQ